MYEKYVFACTNEILQLIQATECQIPGLIGFQISFDDRDFPRQKAGYSRIKKPSNTPPDLKCFPLPPGSLHCV